MKKKKTRFQLKKVIVFDLETTGFLPEGEIIEIGAIKYIKQNTRFRRLEIFTERVKPETSYWKEAAARTHKIKKKDIVNCRSLAEVLSDFLGFLENDAVVIGHRIGFDCNFIKEYCRRLNLPVPCNYVLDTYKIATEICKIDQEIAKKLLVPSFELHLKDLVQYFNVKFTLVSPHRAYIDVINTAEVFFKMKKKFGLTPVRMKPEKFDEIGYKIIKFKR